MIPPIILIVLFSAFVFHYINVMVKRQDDLHAFAFFVLYIYTIFAQIGYAYFPELSIFIGAYFGPKLFYEYWLFIFLSFFFTYAIYLKVTIIGKNRILFKVQVSNSKYRQNIFFFITIVLFLSLFIFFNLKRSQFAWGAGNPMVSQWFGLGFGLFSICVFYLYVLFRNKSFKKKTRQLSLFLFLIFISFIITVSIAAGARSNILYFFLTLFFYEVTPLINTIRFHKKLLFISLFLGIPLINGLMIISNVRETGATNLTFSTLLKSNKNDENSSNKSLSENIILQDYYTPSHLLFISMHYNIVDPIETLKSNLANSFIFFKYPYLTQTISKINGNDYERGEGWGYYFFVEGYNALGWFGIFYNAIFWNLCMGLWCLLTKSDNHNFNKIILSVLTLLIVGAMRSGQTCSFIHQFWLILIPAFILLSFATNSKIVILKNKKYVR